MKLHDHSWIHGLPLRIKFRRSKLYISVLPPILISYFVGILASIMGVGGGFILVPAMIYLLGMSTQVVIATSLMQILFVSITSTIMHAYINQTVDVVLAALMILGGVIGAQLGARLGNVLKAEYLRGVLAIIVLIVCAKIFVDLTFLPGELFSIN